MPGKISKRKVFNRVYEIISTVIITLAVLFAVLLISGIRMYRVRSGSMGDLLPVDSVCFVSSYSGFDSIKPGDIVAFRVGDDLLVTHRVIRVTDEGLFTQGDENDIPDPDPVTRENYIGKTVFAVSRFGALLGVFSETKGRIILGICLLIVVAAGFFYRRNKE